MKKRGASRGADNFLIESKQELIEALEQNRRQFLVQRYVPNDGDLRVIVMNGEVVRVIKRHRVEGSHLSNTSQGAKADIIDVSEMTPQIIDMSIKASYVCNREITGVDVMINTENGDPIILEVNNMPQLVSGAFVEEKVKALHDSLIKSVKHLD